MTTTLQRSVVPAALALLLAACQSAAPGTDGNSDSSGKPEAGSGPVSLPFLLSMDFNEASAISAQKSIIAPYAKVAADSIEVLRTGPDGQPRRVRAKGHVFVQLDYDLPAHALCQEALIGEKELILRGKPILQRGTSTAEGTSDVTAFYLNSHQLRIVGPHKVTSVGELLRKGQPLGAWSGPNPLLPALNAEAVPDAVVDDLQKSLEAEMALQQSRVGVPPAFPNGEASLLSKPVEVPEDKPSSQASKPDDEKKAKANSTEEKPGKKTVVKP